MPDAAGKPSRWNLILRQLPRYRRAILAGLVTLVLANLSFVAAPLMLREGVRAIELPLRDGEPVDPGRVALLAAAMLGIVAFGGICSFARRYLLMGTSRRAEADLRREVFAHIQRLPMRFFDLVRTGDLMSRATADIEAARMAIGPAFMYLVDSVLSLGLALAVMFSVNVPLTLVALLPLAGIAAGLFVLAPRIHRASREVQDRLAAISARAQESFAGARVVKTFATEEHEQQGMESQSRGYLDANVALARIRGLTWSWIALMSAGGLGVVLFVGGRQVIRGEFDVGGLFLFNQLQLQLTWPMMSFGWVLSMVQRGAAGLDRIGEVMRHAPERSAAGTAHAPRGELAFRNVSFGYGREPVLDGIDLDVPAGTTLGLVGPTGSGKSTLVSLLPRLYEPSGGSILLDGRELSSIPLPDLRAALAFVPQEGFLFSTSLRENVAFGRPGASEAEIRAAVRDAQLERDLEQFPAGLDTVVGERGVTLSGGQKQRVALARAILSAAPVLVLDDALSAVDAETEAAILRNLRRLSAGRTVIVVAHRVSAVRDAGQIVFLDDGRIRERGTHAELLALGGEYARLAQAQELEAEIEAMEPAE